jgi:hypothetical protein
VAIFGKKKTGDIEAPFMPQPDKARAWFERARQMAASSNYESAFAFYANGFKLDPTDLMLHNEALELAGRYRDAGGEAATSKQIKQVDGETDIDHFVAALFAWWHDAANAKFAMKAVAAAAGAGQGEFGCAMADRLIALARSGDRVLGYKELKQLMELFKSTGAWNQALAVGQAALRAKPDDSILEKQLNELAAERAMEEGGYNELTGEAGQFRKFVKDIDKQRELEEEESLAGAGGSRERVIERAKIEFEANPSSPEAVNKYAQLLRKQGTPESIKQSIEVFMAGFRETGEYRFRMAAADLKIQAAADQIRQLELKAEQEPGDESRERLAAAEAELLGFKKKEYEERASKYPTDRMIRFQLGELAIEDGDINLAMECFQKAKDEPRLRVRASHALGNCFAREEWHTEAVAEYNEALKALEGGDTATELAIRYDLMKSLTSKAERDSNVDMAREALDICSSIARKDITYRDIRDCRRHLDDLVRSLE